jgi:HEAT repeat protein
MGPIKWPLVFAGLLVIISVSGLAIFRHYQPQPEQLVSKSNASGPAQHQNSSIPEANSAEKQISFPRTDSNQGSSVDTLKPDFPEKTSIKILVEGMVSALKSGDGEKVDDYYEKLVQCGDESVSAMSELLVNNSDPNVQLTAAEILAEIGTPSAISELIYDTENVKDSELKEELSKLIGDVDNHKCWPVLRDAALTSEDPAVLRGTQKAVSTLAEENIVQDLSAGYGTSENSETKSRIANLIGSIRNADAAPSLKEIAQADLPVDESALQQAALNALAGIGSGDATDFLLQVLSSDSPEKVYAASEAIEKVRTDEARAALLTAIQNPKSGLNEIATMVAINSLANYPDEEVSQILEQFAQNDGKAGQTAQAVLNRMKPDNKE